MRAIILTLAIALLGLRQASGPHALSAGDEHLNGSPTKADLATGPGGR